MSLLSANLQAFIAIAKHGTVHAAAGQLHLTQTGVTQRIRALEKELKTTLFLRSRKGMQLTAEAEALLRYCKNVEDLEGETLSKIQNAGKDRSIHLSIAGPTSIMSSRIVEQCSDLYFEWPKLYLHFLISDAEDRLSLARSAKASLIILDSALVPNEMDSKLLKPEKFLLVASAKWKGRKLNDILENEKLIDFDVSDMTSLNYLKKFSLQDQIKKERLFVNNNEAIIKLFCKGIGYGTLTQEIAKPFLESGKLIPLNGGALMEESLALAWYPRPEMPPYFKALINKIK